MYDDSIVMTLHRLLDANAGFALDGRGTTTHCPMALGALAGMGASADRLQAFFDQWQRRFGVPAPRERIEMTTASWPVALGDQGAFLSLRDFFKEWIGRCGADAVLTQVLSQVPFAPATGAFHAVIRLAYGLEAGHAGEIAAGLAALVTGNLPIDSGDASGVPAASPESGLPRLSARFNGKVFPKRSSITAQLRDIATDPDFGSAMQPAPMDPTLLDSLARIAIALYWQEANFTTLHMVTGIDAIRRIAARVPAAMSTVLARETWSAFCAAYVAIGVPATDQAVLAIARIEADQPSLPGWDKLLARAMASDDDHVIKMTYTCWRAGQQDMERIYRAAACRLTGAGEAR